jgi:geranylgeranyl diphosphate synthase type I
MRVEVMCGQYLDVAEQARGGESLESALRVARYKSAGYTVERPLQLGAALAGAPDSMLDALGEFGVPLGEAFQLRDDLLGVYGDPAATGKPAGDDLREGKRTVLVAVALARSSAAEHDLITTRLGDRTLDDEAVDVLRDTIAASGARDEVERMIGVRLDAALRALDRLDIEEESASALRRLALAATERTE